MVLFAESKTVRLLIPTSREIVVILKTIERKTARIIIDSPSIYRAGSILIPRERRKTKTTNINTNCYIFNLKCLIV